MVFIKDLSCFQPRLDELLSVSCLDQVRANKGISSVFTYNRFH